VNEKFQTLKQRLAVVSDLRNVSGLLGWDLQTYMPPKGARARANQLATIDRLSHEYFTADEIGVLLNELATATPQLNYDSDEASLLRVTQRDYTKAKRLPSEFVEELSRATAMAFEAWHKARSESNFKLFQPHLEKIIELKIQQADYVGYTDRIYDALLDDYEPGMTTAQVEAIFAPLKKELTAFVAALANKADVVSDAVLHREYDEQKQWDFGIAVIKQLGFDFEGGRQDKSVHPFTSGFGLGDTRITTRVDKHFLSRPRFLERFTKRAMRYTIWAIVPN
jgi:carboxypeptidase Taq